jgi:hypothetical protein
VPGLTQTTLHVPLIAPQLEYTPRTNQVDFAMNKVFSVGHTRFIAIRDQGSGIRDWQKGTAVGGALFFVQHLATIART